MVLFANVINVRQRVERGESKSAKAQGKQCRERWCNQLDPNVKKGQWTPEEEELIIKLQREIGNKWSQIASKLIGRTDNSVKNHWHGTLKQRVVDYDSNSHSYYSDDKISSIVASITALKKNKK